MEEDPPGNVKNGGGGGGGAQFKKDKIDTHKFHKHLQAYLKMGAC